MKESDLVLQRSDCASSGELTTYMLEPKIFKVKMGHWGKRALRAVSDSLNGRIAVPSVLTSRISNNLLYI